MGSRTYTILVLQYMVTVLKKSLDLLLYFIFVIAVDTIQFSALFQPISI